MATVLNRTTKRLIRSVNTPDYPVGEWIINPDMSAVAGFASKYWIITGDAVSLMDQTARDAVDAQELSDSRDTIANELDQLEGIMRAFAGVVLDEINTLRTEHSLPDRTLAQLKTAIRGKLGA